MTTPGRDAALQSGGRRAWWLVVALAIVGAVLAWLAFGVGIQEKPPPDVTKGVDLVEPRERGGGSR